MPNLTTAQKTAISQFVAATGANEKLAQRFLKSANYRLDVAADAYFIANAGNPASITLESTLEKMFDDIRDPGRDTDKDAIGVESTMNYLQQLNVNPESCEIFVVLDIVQAPSFGEIKREGYVNGWKATGATASKSGHQSFIRSRVAALATDPFYFRQVYRNAFIAGKEPEQKALALENALVYWDMMFKRPGRPWATPRRDWLSLWKQFLGEKWTRSVNRDMWNQTLEFATKSMEDPTLRFWSEDGAWPGVVDDFVLWCREKGIVPIPKAGEAGGEPEADGEGMVMDG